MVPGPLELLCPAKINLELKVLGRRSDDYHQVETILQRVSLFDRIRLQLKADSGIELACCPGSLPRGEQNLVWQAATVLLKRVPHKTGVSIRLHKNIPLAAGLGGGSSDAAATLLGLNRLLGYPLSREDLLELGASLGADVPFFVMEVSAALGQGRGDVLTPVFVPGFWYVLVHPGFEVSTAWAYGQLKLELTRSENQPIKDILNQGSFKWGKLLHNDLEEVTLAAHPQIGAVKTELLSLGGLQALMSGSGPTVFALFPDRRSAWRAYQGICSRRAWKAFLVRSF